MKGFLKNYFSSLYGLASHYFKTLGSVMKEVPMFKVFVEKSGPKKEPKDSATQTAENTAKMNASLERLNKTIDELNERLKG